MLPLEGIRVVELASNIAGPFGTLVLEDLGATVLKIERPGSGDDVRAWPPFQDGTSAPFAAMNRGKRSVAVDVKAAEGAALVRRLLETADAFVVSLRPGKAEKLSLGWPSLRQTHPHLVYCEISGYGPVGPNAAEPGYDAILQAYSGLMDLTGHADGPPARVGTGVIDFGTGMWAALGVVAALHRRNQTGRGGQVQPSLLGTATGFLMHHIASMTMGGVVPKRIGTAQHNTAPYEAITARDGLVMVGVTSQALWRTLCAALDCADIIEDPRFATNQLRVANRGDLVRALSARVADRDAADVRDLLTAAGVPCSRIRSVEALLDDEQVAALGLLQVTESGERLAVSPVAIDGEIADLGDKLTAMLGADTDQVLRDLGCSAEELAALRDRGVIADA